MKNVKAQEGTLYKTLHAGGKSFRVYYGYRSEEEREYWDEPAPLYPDFTENPQYTDGGKPFVTADQDVCDHYVPKPQVSGENWCNDCEHFTMGEEIIGVCENPNRLKDK